MNIVLDIDGTLIKEFHPDSKIESDSIRPHLEPFLRFCFSHFQHVSIWTAANREWYNMVYEQVFHPILLRIEKQFSHVLTREHCTQSRQHVGSYFHSFSHAKTTKKLKKLFSKPHHSKHNTLVVDNTPSTYMHNFGNAIFITTYNGHPEDQELKNLMQYLKNVQLWFQNHQTIRNMDKRLWWLKFQKPNIKESDDEKNTDSDDGDQQSCDNDNNGGEKNTNSDDGDR